MITCERLATRTSLVCTTCVDEDAAVEECCRGQQQKDWDKNESNEDESFLLLEKGKCRRG